MAPRLVVLGWDSATFDVIDPLIEQGRLSTLGDMMAGGFRAPLRSTWPPMTDCAWTSAFTGRNPGAHGIFGSWYRAPGRYACRYFSSRDRRVPALWELTEGVRFAVWNVPMTFPPTGLNGVMVAGYGALPSSRFCEPAEVQNELSARWPIDDLLDRAPYGSLAGFRDDLVRGLETQAQALRWLAEHAQADCVIAVWPHIDRAQHFFWRYRDGDHPLGGAIDDVYEAADRATASVVEAFPDADVVVLSDHGAGPLHGDVNVSGWLARRGYAAHAGAGTRRMSDLVWTLPPWLRRAGKRVAPGLARRAFGAALAGDLGGFDWARTRAFLGFHGDLWLNLDGREEQGAVSPGEAEALGDEIATGLLDLSDPATGAPLFRAVHRRAEIYSGAAEELAPDLVLDSWSTGYRVAPKRRPADDLVRRAEPLAGVGVSWSSDHRPLGIFAASGPRIATGSAEELSLYDVCPTLLALLQQPVPDDLDGRVATVALDHSWLSAHPPQRTGSSGERETRAGYSDEEAAAVASHLKDLGYIE